MDKEEFLKVFREDETAADYLGEENRDMLADALEKQIPKKPVLKLHTNRLMCEYEEYYCPNCGEWLTWELVRFNYCYECGHKIDWRKVE